MDPSNERTDNNSQRVHNTGFAMQRPSPQTTLRGQGHMDSRHAPRSPGAPITMSELEQQLLAQTISPSNAGHAGAHPHQDSQRSFPPVQLGQAFSGLAVSSSPRNETEFMSPPRQQAPGGERGRGLPPGFGGVDPWRYGEGGEASLKVHSPQREYQQRQGRQQQAHGHAQHGHGLTQQPRGLVGRKPNTEELFSSSLFSFPKPEEFQHASSERQEQGFGVEHIAVEHLGGGVRRGEDEKQHQKQNGSPPSTPTAEVKKQQGEEDIKTLTAKKMARAARFYWKPVGQLSVRPEIAGPNQRIEVQWRIPISEVSPSSYNKRESAHNDNLDWIGLFRSRKRVDESDSHILTREIRGSANVIYNERDNQKYVVGQIQLRTPRGVGSYDFRYFRAEEPEEANTEEEEAEESPTKLPLARSGEVTVEVQGGALYEALDYVENSFDDSKRISNATAQLAILLGQIRTLRRPVLNHSREGNGRGGRQRNSRGRQRNNRNRNVPMSPAEMKNAEEAQEQDIAQKLKATVFLCMKKVVSRCKSLAASAEKKMPDLRTKLKHFEKLEEERRELVAREEELDAEAFGVWREAKSAYVNVERSINQSKREHVSLSSALRAVIDETLKCNPLRKWFEEREWHHLLQFMQTFCPISGRFYPSLNDMHKYYEEELRIRFTKNVDMELPTLIPGYPVVPNVRLNIYKGLPRAYLKDLVQEVRRLGHSLQPPPEFGLKRMKFLDALEKTVNEKVDWNCKAKLVPFGSSANNFGSVSSDLDICLVLLPFHAKWPQALIEDTTPTDPVEAVKAVEDLAVVLEELGMKDVDDQRKMARIPIVKFVNHNGLECDVCINNRLAIRNTMLLHTYSRIDPRVCEMAQIIKRWVKARGINNPAKHTLPSYGYLLLLIRYLQASGVVPVLQELSPRWRGDVPSERDPSILPVLISGPDGQRHDTYFYGDPAVQHLYAQQIEFLQQYAARNKKTTGELLIGFFEFYAFQLDYRRYVVSIRTREWVTKEQKAAEDSWKLHLRVAIEDPFETGYDVAHVLREAGFHAIRVNFARAYSVLVGRCLEESATTGDMTGAKALNILLEKVDVEEQSAE